jgi:hypothetical protein
MDTSNQKKMKEFILGHAFNLGFDPKGGVKQDKEEPSKMVRDQVLNESL